MNAPDKNRIAESIKCILHKMMEETGIEEEIHPTTWLVADLGLESIDIVVLGTTLQQQLNEKLPFSEYLCQVRDIRFNEFVSFVAKHVRETPS